MKLYYAPGACSLADHIALHEAGLPFEHEKVDLKAKRTEHGADYTTINPKGKVPTLVRDDGTVMTKYGAIATWLARTNPDKGLIRADPEAERQGIEIMDYAVGTLHLQGFGRLFKTASYEPQDVLHKTLKLGQTPVKE